MILRAKRWATAAVFAVAAAAAAAAQSPSREPDRAICAQLGDLADVRTAVQRTLDESRTAEAAIVGLAKRLADDLDGCRRTPGSPSCLPGLRSQTTAAIQKLTAQAEDLQAARQAIEQRLKEIEEKRAPILARLTDKDSCPHAR
jgi:hypothetical protein